MKGKIELGDKVKDKLSELQGTVIGIHDYLNGCRRVSIHTASKDPIERILDEPQLKLLSKTKNKVKKKSIGGTRPDPYRHTPSKRII